LGTAATTQAVGLLLLVGFGATMFFDKSIGGIGLAFTWAFFYFADKLGSTIQTENVRTVVEQMSAQYYRQSRRTPHTINRTEIVERLQHLFVNDFGFEIAALTPDALLF
jgi:hypothetical protein